MYNLLIGGAAGQGIDTTAAILEKLLKRSGYHVFTIRDFMSRVRGGHNFSLIRFGAKPVHSHSNVLDGIIAMDEETISQHRDQLKNDGFILCDRKLSVPKIPARCSSTWTRWRKRSATRAFRASSRLVSF